MDWYLLVLKKYADFNGRARRKEYWLFGVFNVVIFIALEGIALGAFALIGEDSGIAALAFIPAFLYGLAIAIPSLAVTVRRLHDTGRSGWWYLIGFVPFVGGIIVLVFMLLDGEPGTNVYGPNPKEQGRFDPYAEFPGNG